MQRGVARDHASEVVVEDWEDVVRDLGVYRVGPGTGPLKLVAGVGPKGEVGVCVGAGFRGGEQGEGGRRVMEAQVEVRGYGGAQGVRLGVGGKGVEGFGEGDGGREEGCVGGCVVGGGVRWVVLGRVRWGVGMVGTGGLRG